MEKCYELDEGKDAGMTEYKINDEKSGYEKGYTVKLEANYGDNMV